MGALTGNSIQSTYLDLVQLGKSGAGLPAHAGKEAAVYDGSGAQIIGRTAVRHWLDPHPDAASFAETWEFSTTGDMTQAALETAGWTFNNWTGSVTGGALLLTATGTNDEYSANFATSLAGDFDIVVTVASNISYGSIQPRAGYVGGVGVADTSNDVAHSMALYTNNTVTQGYARYNSAWTTGGGTLSGAASTYTEPCALRMTRVSGTIYFFVISTLYATFLEDTDAAADCSGTIFIATVADGDTFQKIFFNCAMSALTVGGSFRVLSIRRFQ